MHNCPQVSVSVNDDYSQAWRADKYLHYLINIPLIIYWSTVKQYTTFSQKIFHMAFSFLIFFLQKIISNVSKKSAKSKLLCADQKF